MLVQQESVNVPTWEEDYQDRVNPTLMTELLRTSIPVLAHSDWSITEVKEGACTSVLPLNAPTTNQHGTHQAALISLSADYTGGLALATLLRGVPLAGIHRCSEEESASLWLASMNVKYKSPSSGHLVGTCQVDAKKAEMIKTRYRRGDRVLVALDVEFHSNGELVAVAEMKYFAQPTIQLTPAPGSTNRSALFGHKLKASARMIAGVRSRMSLNPRLTVQCPHATHSAGPHGQLLANRLEASLPQLPDMVLARTQHCDEALNAMQNVKQVVMLGAGLDLRPLRHAHRDPEMMWFEIDLPEMIAERRRVVSDLPTQYQDQRVQLEADFRCDELKDVLGKSDRFDPSLPTFFIYEGCSMYFSNEENRGLLKQVHELMQHSDSMLWTDIVSQEVVTGRTNDQSILSFLKGMEELGETFVFGLDDPEDWLKQMGFNNVSSRSCREYLQENDLVFDTYTFCVAGA